MNIIVDQNAKINFACQTPPTNQENRIMNVGNEGIILNPAAETNAITFQGNVNANFNMVNPDVIFFLRGNNNINLRLSDYFDKLEIRDNSELIAKVDFSVADILLTSGSLNLTHTGVNACTTRLNLNEGSKFSLNSKAGFDMTIVIDQVEYTLKSESLKEISSDTFNQVIDLVDKINLSDGEYSFELLQKYFKTIKNDTIYKLIQQNIEVDNINARIDEQFIELAGIAKSLTGDLEVLPAEMLVHVFSFLKPSDINYNPINEEVSEVGSVVDFDHLG